MKTHLSFENLPSLAKLLISAGSVVVLLSLVTMDLNPTLSKGLLNVGFVWIGISEVLFLRKFAKIKFPWITALSYVVFCLWNQLLGYCMLGLIVAFLAIRQALGSAVRNEINSTENQLTKDSGVNPDTKE